MDEESSSGRVIRIERESEEPALPVCRHLIGDTEERFTQEQSIFDNANSSGLLHDEQAGIAGRRRQVQRRVQAGHDFLEPRSLARRWLAGPVIRAGTGAQTESE